MATTMWLTRDERGRPKAAFSRPVPGGEEMDAETAQQLLDARRAEKLAERPREDRIADAVRSSPKLLAALFDAAVKADPTNPVIAAAKAKIDPEPRRTP